jgi:integrase
VKAKRKLSLTELFVKKTRPQDRAFLVWDVKQHGLALRIQPTGARSWKCIYSFRGRPRWLHLGDANAIGLGDARVLAAETMLAVARGGDPAAEKKAQRGSGTFAELAQRYLDEHAKRENKSWRQGEALIRRYVLPRWGKLQSATLARADVKAMMRSIEAPVLANQVLAAVSAIFTWAVREEILPANPCKLVGRNPVQSRERILSTSELPQFLAAFGEMGLQGAALRAILLTGQRPGEVIHMRREHIVDGWWEMPGAPVPTLDWPGTKNAQSHRVWLPKAAREIIDSEATTGFVFAGPRGRPVGDLQLAMRDLCRKLGITDTARPHDLRRTHGTTVTGLGFGRDAMNRIQNHRDGGIAGVYDRHKYPDENKKIMESVAAHILGLAEGRAAGVVVAFKK